MRSSAIKKAERWIKGIWLALRFSRMTPDQITEWLNSEEHYAQLEALFPSDPSDLVDLEEGVRPGKRADQLRRARPEPLNNSEYLSFLRGGDPGGRPKWRKRSS